MGGYTMAGKAREVLRKLKGTHLADPLDSPVMRRLTRRVIALRAKLVHDSAAMLIRLGRAMEDAMEEVDYHNYRRWLRGLSISVTTSKRWRAIYRLARRRPDFLARIRKVGGVKLWRLAAMEPKEADRLLRALGVGGIDGMKTGAFLSLTAPHVVITSNGHPSRRGQGLVNKLHQWTLELKGADVRRLRQPDVRKRLQIEARGLRKALARLEKTLLDSEETG